MACDTPQTCAIHFPDNDQSDTIQRGVALQSAVAILEPRRRENSFRINADGIEIDITDQLGNELPQMHSRHTSVFAPNASSAEWSAYSTPHVSTLVATSDCANGRLYRSFPLPLRPEDMELSTLMVVHMHGRRTAGVARPIRPPTHILSQTVQM